MQGPSPAALQQMEAEKEDEGTMGGTISPSNPDYALINQLVEGDSEPLRTNNVTKPAAPATKKCKSTMTMTEIGKGMFLTGHTFMNRYYMIFDR